MGSALPTIATIAEIGASASTTAKNLSGKKEFAPAYGGGQRERREIVLSNPYAQSLLGSNLMEAYKTSTGARRGK
jgi:hypothetical protein